MNPNNPNSGGEAPKLHIDTDWKSQARAEKEKLAEQAKAKQAAKPAAPAPGSLSGAPVASGDPGAAPGLDDMLGEEESAAGPGGTPLAL